MKKYIVTGFAGFVGSHVADALLAEGHTVVGFDDFSAGLKRNVPKHKNFTQVLCDLSEKSEVQWHVHHFDNCDGVFHLAADARIQPSITDPRFTIENNVGSTLNILEVMRIKGVKKIVYSGSSSCYGRGKPPFYEDAATDPLNAYAASKLMGEMLCGTYAKVYNIDSVILRYFNVFGPRSPIHLSAYNPVIGLFFKQAIKGEKLTVVGDGLQTRDFTWIEDVVQANIKAMEKRLPEDMKVINIGTGKSISIISLARKINELCGRHPEDLVHLEPRPGESHQTRAQNYRSAYRLGLDYTSLDDALAKLKPYYENA